MRRNGFERYHSLIQVGYFLILTHFGQDAEGLLTELSPSGSLIIGDPWFHANAT